MIFFAVNNWTAKFFPGFGSLQMQKNKIVKSWYKSLAEWVFDNKAGDHLNKWLLKITTRRWQHKSQKGERNKNGHAMKLETGRHFSRSNPGSFQEKVLAMYERRLKELNVVNSE